MTDTRNMPWRALFGRAQHEAALANSYDAAIHYARVQDRAGFDRELVWFQREIDALAALDFLAALAAVLALPVRNVPETVSEAA